MFVDAEVLEVGEQPANLCRERHLLHLASCEWLIRIDHIRVDDPRVLDGGTGAWGRPRVEASRCHHVAKEDGGD